MDGYDVIGCDDHKVGEVVAQEGDLLIVEGGLLRKSRHAVPKAFAHADEGEKVVRLSVSKDVVVDSPTVDEDDVDRQAVALHYGLSGPSDAPETLGYGDVTPDDPAESAEVAGARRGVEPTPEQRARIRQGGEDEPGPHGRQIIPPDAHDKV